MLHLSTLLHPRRSSTMTNLTLIIGNKNYSSWSLRPWIFMRHFGLDFQENRIPLFTETTDELRASCKSGNAAARNTATAATGCLVISRLPMRCTRLSRCALPVTTFRWMKLHKPTCKPCLPTPPSSNGSKQASRKRK